MATALPRPLLPEERATLLALLDYSDFDGRDALVEQVDSARVDSHCGCGCATVGFSVDPRAPSAGKTYRPIPNEADVLDDGGKSIGGVIVFVDDGYLSSLEIYSIADEPIRQFPPLDRLRLFKLDSRELGHVTILALDVGSSSVRAQSFDEQGVPEGELRQERYATDDADEVAAAVRLVLDGREPDATSCFAHSLVAVDAGWNALTPILGWRDTRSAGAAERLARRLDADAVHARTGAFLHSSFWPAKIAWLAETEPDVFRRAAWFVSFADYLRDAPETSLSMASSSGLLDLTTEDWDEELLATLGIGRERLPQIADVPLWVDAACSNAGAGCTTRERAALMVGTSGALRVLYETERPEPRPGLFLYLADERRVVEGGALSDGGNLHNWLERTLAGNPSNTVLQGEGGWLAGRDPRDHRLVFLPFLGGERSTGWNPRARGTIHGLTFSTTALDIRQAAYEGVAFRFAAIADLLPHVREVVATGGALLHDRDWIQIMADALARPVTVSAVPEASLRGAAVFALERLGHAAAEAPTAGVVEPRPDRAEAYRAAREEQQLLYDALT